MFLIIEIAGFDLLRIKSISKKTVFSLDKTLDVLSRNKIDINEKNFFKIKMLFLD